MPKAQTNTSRPLTMAMEDYLEAIFDLEKEKKVVRVKDIAKRLKVKMPTVTSMLKTLSTRGLVHYVKYEYVELTKEGELVGKTMRKRHQALNRFLVDILQIAPETADEEACKMEHALSDNTLASLTDFMAFIQACPRAGESWLKRFADYRKQGQIALNCEENAEEFACHIQESVSAKPDPKSLS